MKQCVFNIIAILLAGLSLPLHADDVPGAQPRRISIVDVGMEQNVPAALIDFLYVELSQYPDVILLERQEINRLLQEQRTALFAADGETDSAVAIQTGKIWATDAFLMLESIHGEDRRKHLRVRLVDAWHGLKIHEYTFIEPEDDAFESTAAFVARNAHARIGAVKRDAADMLLVGVMGFENVGLSRQWDYLSEIIGSMIEQRIARNPGIILLERQRVGALREERELVHELPEALRPSMILIDGEYEFQHAGHALTIRTRSRRDRKRIGTTEVQGSLDDLAQLTEKVVNAALEDIPTAPSAQPMDPAWEADMLLQQAFTTRDYARAMSSVEAAMMLVPDRQDVKLAYLQLLYVWRTHTPMIEEDIHSPDDPGLRDEAHDQDDGLNAFLWHRARRYITVLGDVIRNWRSEDIVALQYYAPGYEYLKIPRNQIPTHFYHAVFHLPTMLNFLSAENVKNEEVREFLDADAKQVLLKAVARLAHKERGMERGACNNALLLLLRFWPEDALAHMEMARSRFGDDYRFRFVKAFLNTENPAVIRKLEVVLQELAASNDLHERRRGKFCLVYLAARPQDNQDFDEARRRFENYKTFFLGQLSHRDSDFNNPYWILTLLRRSHNFLREFGDYLYFEDKEDNLRYKAEQVEEILEHALAHNLYKRHTSWSRSGVVALILAQAGRPEAAYDLMQRIINHLERMVEEEAGLRHASYTRYLLERHKNLARNLLRQHPELEKHITPPIADDALAGAAAVTVLSYEDIMSAVRARYSAHKDLRRLTPHRIVVGEDVMQILCNEGVFRVRKADFNVTRFDPAPAGSSIPQRGLFVAENGDLYTYDPKGVVVFPADGEPRLVEGTDADTIGEVSDMDIMNRTLYLVVDDSESLIAVDLDSGKHRTILSSRRNIGGQTFQSGEIWSVVADKYQNRLLLTSSVSGRFRTRAYNPVSGELTTGNFYSAALRNYRNGNDLVVADFRRVYFWDLAQDKYTARFEAASHRFDSVYIGSFCRLGINMFCIHKTPFMQDPRIERFSKYGGEPENMMPHFFPSKERPQPTAMDMAAYGDGDLLLLMNDGLYVVRDIVKKLAAREQFLASRAQQGASVTREESQNEANMRAVANGKVDKEHADEVLAHDATDDEALINTLAKRLQQVLEKPAETISDELGQQEAKRFADKSRRLLRRNLHEEALLAAEIAHALNPTDIPLQAMLCGVLESVAERHAQNREFERALQIMERTWTFRKQWKDRGDSRLAPYPQSSIRALLERKQKLSSEQQERFLQIRRLYRERWLSNRRRRLDHVHLWAETPEEWMDTLFAFGKGYPEELTSPVFRPLVLALSKDYKQKLMALNKERAAKGDPRGFVECIMLAHENPDVFTDAAERITRNINQLIDMAIDDKSDTGLLMYASSMVRQAAMRLPASIVRPAMQRLQNEANQRRVVNATIIGYYATPYWGGSAEAYKTAAQNLVAGFVPTTNVYVNSDFRFEYSTGFPTDSVRFFAWCKMQYERTTNRELGFDLSPAPSGPHWKQQKKIFELSETERRNSAIQGVVQQDNLVFLAVFRRGQNPRTELIELDLDTKTQRVVSSIVGGIPPDYPHFNPSLFDKYLFHLHRNIMSVGKHAVYLPGQGGLIIFPRNGDTPLVLRSGEELPDSSVISVIEIDQALYLALDKRVVSEGGAIESMRGMLLQTDLNGGNPVVIASSERKEKLSTLDNCEPYFIDGFMHDEKNSRLYFIITTGRSGSMLRGIWMLDLKSGEIMPAIKERTALFSYFAPQQSGDIWFSGGDRRIEVMSWNPVEQKTTKVIGNSGSPQFWLETAANPRCSVILNDVMYVRAKQPMDYTGHERLLAINKRNVKDESPMPVALEPFRETPPNSPIFLQEWQGNLVDADRHTLWLLKPNVRDKQD